MITATGSCWCAILLVLLKMQIKVTKTPPEEECQRHWKGLTIWSRENYERNAYHTAWILVLLLSSRASDPRMEKNPCAWQWSRWEQENAKKCYLKVPFKFFSWGKGWGLGCTRPFNLVWKQGRESLWNFVVCRTTPKDSWLGGFVHTQTFEWLAHLLKFWN